MTSSPPVDPPRSGRAPSFKRLPRAIREQQMLDAAVKVFSRRGYHAASMDEIAEDAGISKPMVYAYLGSKEQLFVACLHREGTRLLEAIAEAAGPDRHAPGGAPAPAPEGPPGRAAEPTPEQTPDPDPDPGLGDSGLEQQLWRGLRAFFGFVGAHRDGWAVLYRQARGEPPFAGELAGMRARMVQVVVGLLGRDRPGVRETELEVLAYALVGAAESLADWLVDHPEADPDRLADGVTQALWLGTGRFLRTVDRTGARAGRPTGAGR